MNCLYELLALVVILGDANEAHGEFGERVFLSHVGGEEQHEAQTAIHFASRLERALLMAFAVRTILVLRLVAGVNGMGCHLGAGHVRRVIGQLEADGGIEAPPECVHGLRRVHNGGVRVLKHEHDKIVGVGVGDVQTFAVHGKRGGESAGIHLLHQILGNVLGAQTRCNRIKAETGNRRLRHARCRARDVLRLRLWGGRHGHRSR